MHRGGEGGVNYKCGKILKTEESEDHSYVHYATLSTFLLVRHVKRKKL